MVWNIHVLCNLQCATHGIVIHGVATHITATQTTHLGKYVCNNALPHECNKTFFLSSMHRHGIVP